MSDVSIFEKERSRLNELILSKDNKVIKRIFNLDTNAFAEGALPSKTKELLGLVASLVLRCDDCVRYHLGQCHKHGVQEDELMETLAIGNLIGGTIVIPHLRKAVDFWEELNKTAANA